MQRAKLTNTAVENFQCREGRDQDVLWDGEVKGFGMRLSAKSAVRTYFLQYRVRGAKQERKITIGRHNDPYRVDQARAKALELKAQMLTGVDPVEEVERKETERRERQRLDAAHSVTLREMLEHYLEFKRTSHREPLRPASKLNMRTTIQANLSDWLEKPVATITRNKVIARFIEISKRSPTAGNLTVAHLRSILNHAREQYADEEGNYTILATNPVSRMLQGGYKLNKETPRTRRIPLKRVGQAWLALQHLRAGAKTATTRTAADLVALRMLTALRLNESAALRWSQIDLGTKAIRLLGEIGKTHQDVVLPMSTVLHTILSERAALPRKSLRAREYVFPSPRKNSALAYMRDPDTTMKVVAKAAGCVKVDKFGTEKCALSSHDFRRTLESVARACKIGDDDRRKLLVHAAIDCHSRHYDNSTDPEELRPAVEAIAQFIINAARTAAAQASGANVIQFRRKSG